MAMAALSLGTAVLPQVVGTTKMASDRARTKLTSEFKGLGVGAPARRIARTRPGCSVVRRASGVTMAVKTKDKVKLQVTIEHQVSFGQSLGIMGSARWLNKWEKPLEMRWTEAGWTVEIEARPGDEAEFKFVVCDDNKTVQEWEGGHNRKFSVPSDADVVKAAAKWGSTGDGLTILHKDGQQGETNGSAQSAPSREREADSGDGSSAFAQSWQGREVGFMRSNQHTSQRSGAWDTSGLTGAAKKLVEGDRHAGNWWKKLEVVQNLLTPLDLQSRLEALTCTSIYLQWINTGQIACVEDGGHYRPNKHAGISRTIFRWMEKDSTEQALAASPQSVLVLRKVHPRLPAFTSEFTAAVPLTRIRDIAHRNDIPHDLKQEIKHTIQNKLHRCAGPEDLIATELLLKRVSATPGQYSGDFLEQLRIFYAELKDFFNAASLTEQLESIRPSLDEVASPMLASFLACKRQVDSLPANPEGSTAMDALLAALHSLTGLRATLLHHLSSGLRNDAADDAIAMRQKWRLAEIGLEDYSFVLLSRVVNEAERLGGSPTMSAEAERGPPRLFDACVGAAVLALRQVGLSGWEQAECLCLEQELSAWQKAGVGLTHNGGVAGPQDLRWWALRLKASLDRAKRLTAGYTEALLGLYAGPAQALGGALGVQENAARTFAEAEIRASVVFQLDKLVTMLLKSVRLVLKADGWDVLMPGTATGVIKEVECIDPAKLQQCTSDTILLVHRAEGDEEVRAAGDQVRAVILLQELPHLSHLAVRARQERVPFVTCDEQEWIDRLKRAAAGSERVKLEASAEGVRLTIPAPQEDGPSPSQGQAKAKSLAVASPKLGANKDVARPVIPLPEASLDSCGAKAASCAKLLNIAADSRSKDPTSTAAFFAPQGAAIPFGMLEETVRAAGAHQEYLALVQATETTPLEQLDEACSKLRSLVQGLKLSDATMRALGELFPASTRLIVRSSANVEDLAGMSGAGLYDSIPNVRLSDPDAFSAAVTGVWASLFSRRAVLSRRAAGVRQEEAAMAVLVQELMAPELSFVLHTKSLLDGTTHQVHVEVAPGLGETLASGTRGTAWRFAVDKATGEMEMSSFANFSEQLLVLQSGPGDGTVTKRAVDYSRQQLSVDRESLRQLARQLCQVGTLLESSMGSAQDIEGCLAGSKLVVVQSRPQP